MVKTSSNPFLDNSTNKDYEYDECDDTVYLPIRCHTLHGKILSSFNNVSIYEYTVYDNIRENNVLILNEINIY